MPKTPARDDYFTQSFRFTPEQAATIKEEAKRCGSVTAFIRELLDDHRTLYGLPQLQVELLEAGHEGAKARVVPGLRSPPAFDAIANAPRRKRLRYKTGGQALMIASTAAMAGRAS